MSYLLKARARTGPVTVLVADRDRRMLGRIRSALAENARVQVVDEESTGLAAFDAARALSPEVVLIGLLSPPMDQLETALALDWADMGVSVVLLVDPSDPPDGTDAFAAGVTGILRRDLHVYRSGMFSLLVETTASYEEVLDSRAGLSIPESIETRVARVFVGMPLKPQERDVLHRLARGATIREIARELGISSAAVMTTREYIFMKVGSMDRAALLARARDEGLLD